MARPDAAFSKAGQFLQHGNNSAEAVALLQLSVDRQKNRLAAFNLGELYYTGWPGTAPDYQKSADSHFFALQPRKPRELPLPDHAVEAAMNNFTELLKMGKARCKEEHAAWLTGAACKHCSKSVRAMAALCTGLQLYDTGKRAEAARWYKVGAEVGKTGEKYRDAAVESCVYNMRRIAGIQMTEDEKAHRADQAPFTAKLWTASRQEDLPQDVPLPACAACGRDDPSVKLKKCGQCGQVSYCSVDCQRRHWNLGAHKQACSKAQASQRRESLKTHEEKEKT